MFKKLLKRFFINSDHAGNYEQPNHEKQTTYEMPMIEKPDLEKHEYQTCNQMLQFAVFRALPIFKQSKLRSDSFDEYWHTVYHRNREDGTVDRRFVGRHSIAEKQLNSARRAYGWIQNELRKPGSRITDTSQATAAIKELSDALMFSGYELTVRDTWVRIK